MTPDAIEHQSLDRESSPATPAHDEQQTSRRRRIAWLAGLVVLVALVVWVIHHRLTSAASEP
ncbi:MAG: hypothetical protein KGO22_07080, partial [Gammaproteobacteria bacterium]|nr:hypothetical protein [Gammaproteobacteria bacterium]